MAQSVAPGNPRTIAWIMLPQYHSSTHKVAVLKNKRLMEDKVFSFLGSRLWGNSTLFSFILVSYFPWCDCLSKSRTVAMHYLWMFLQTNSFDCHIPQKMQRLLEAYEIAVNFSDTAHGGDKRKRSKQCFLHGILVLNGAIDGRSMIWDGSSNHHNVIVRTKFEDHQPLTPSQNSGLAAIVGVQGVHPWSRSWALLGSISDVDPDRVGDLQNPEPDRPLAPHWRVS